MNVLEEVRGHGHVNIRGEVRGHGHVNISIRGGCEGTRSCEY